MAAALPAKLKIPSISPLATRAAQLEKFRPIVSYWCNYQIVQQILGKNLHAADDECRDYTMALMDKLETAKNQSPPVDAVVDDIAAKAYIEQFALETFQKADDAIHSDRASKQTIDTFQAASTFLELLSIWTNPLDAETTSKIKYAKYHALRIAKAIKAGEDPNASNPKEEVAPALSPGLATPGDQMQIDSLHPSSDGGIYRPPTVESAPESMLPSRTASVPQPGSAIVPPPPEPAKAEPDVSPIEPADANSRNGSVGGGYFPEVPTFTSELSAPTMPTAEPDLGPASTQTAPAPDILPSGSSQPMQSPRDFYAQNAPQAPQAPQAFSPPPAPVPHHASLPHPAPPAQSLTQAAPPPQVYQAPVQQRAYRTDDEAVAQAQKHAKWAISALNFEDVNTAVKELRIALQALGAS
ncbi:Vta1-like protein [Elsinoe fawcettii]|nr:Vta1-like protein [Elsinoe fawcettii]